MLRISRVGTTDNGDAVVLRLEGQVTGRWVDELRLTSAETLGDNDTNSQLILDLADVSFLDPDAVALLREMVVRRVVLRNCSIFIAEQLRGVTDAAR